jgi:hypothetical protein
MKKLLLFIVLMFIFSCEKDSNCWQCTTVIVTQCGGMASDDTTVSTTLCDKSRNEIEAYESASSSTVTTKIGGLTCTSRSSCKCRKQ